MDNTKEYPRFENDLELATYLGIDVNRLSEYELYALVNRFERINYLKSLSKDEQSKIVEEFIQAMNS